jgi:hypothetical protein
MINHLFDIGTMISLGTRFVSLSFDMVGRFCVAEISMNRYEVFAIDISDTNLKFVEKVCKTINKINKMII